MHTQKRYKQENPSKAGRAWRTMSRNVLTPLSAHSQPRGHAAAALPAHGAAK